MLDSLFYTATEDNITLTALLAAIGASLVLGLIISLVYLLTHKKEGYASSFIITMIMLPAIISVLILLIGSNVARAFSLAGAFSLIRYRSAPGDPKDIAYVFFTMAVGLACGMGFIPYAFVFTAIMCLVMIILHFTKFGNTSSSHMQLSITVPENLNYQDLFDDLLDKYTDSWKLRRVKTCDFGTLFDVVYHIHMKSSADQKQFIDELRCRNGNLTVALTLKEYEDKVMMA